MSVKAKYQDVLNLGEKLEITNGDVQVEDGVLKIKGETKTLYEKNLMWDAIKTAGGNDASDLMANITVADETVYHRHEVVSGDTLGKIAKHYFKDAMKYKQIFAANQNILDNPDVIKVGQTIVIPNL